MKNILSLQNKLTPDDFAPLDENYFKEESLETEEIGYWKASWIRLKSNKIAMVALVLIVIMFIFAFVGPLLSPYSYDQQVRGDEALWPCLKHPFGTDRLGRDILVRCMIGTRISMIVGLVSAVIVMIVGSIYGAISGLIGGKVDIVMMRVVDIIYSVPEILLIVVIKMVISEPLQNLIDTVPMFHGLQKIGSGLIAIFIVYGCLYWVGMARIVRGQILQLKTLDFVTAAEALGCGRATMIKELYRPAHRYRDASDPLSHLHRGLLKLLRNRRICPHGKPWFPDLRGPERYYHLPLPGYFPGGSHQSHHPVLQPLRRRTERCTGSENEKIVESISKMKKQKLRKRR